MSIGGGAKKQSLGFTAVKTQSSMTVYRELRVSHGELYVRTPAINVNQLHVLLYRETGKNSLNMEDKLSLK